jgi:hypothetical protein
MDSRIKMRSRNRERRYRRNRQKKRGCIRILRTEYGRKRKSRKGGQNEKLVDKKAIEKRKKLKERSQKRKEILE